MNGKELTPEQGNLLTTYNELGSRIENKMRIIVDPWKELDEKINNWKAIAAELISSLIADKNKLVAANKRFSEEMIQFQEKFGNLSLMKEKYESLVKKEAKPVEKKNVQVRDKRTGKKDADSKGTNES